VAATLHVYSCKSSDPKEVAAFQAIVAVLPADTQRDLLRIQGRIAVLSEPDTETEAK
jgi:hypothetical protein